MPTEWINALIGGAIIGVSVSLMLLLNGRVTGISGIINGAITPLKGDTAWRWFFVLGLFVGGVAINSLQPEVFSTNMVSPDWAIVAAGLLVGFGTIMGSGCTSGHGVCGISRMSTRSIVATVAFMLAGILSVLLFRYLGVLP